MLAKPASRLLRCSCKRARPVRAKAWVAGPARRARCRWPVRLWGCPATIGERSTAASSQIPLASFKLRRSQPPIHSTCGARGAMKVGGTYTKVAIESPQARETRCRSDEGPGKAPKRLLRDLSCIPEIAFGASILGSWKASFLFTALPSCTLWRFCAALFRTSGTPV